MINESSRFQTFMKLTQYEDTTQASVAAVRSILQSCERSGTVKRVIYTGSVTAASPLKGDGTGFQDFIDESCWTPLHLSFAWCEDFEKVWLFSRNFIAHHSAANLNIGLI